MQPEVHKFASIRNVMKDIGDIDVALMGKIRELTSKEETDDVGELSLDLDGLKCSFRLAALRKFDGHAGEILS